MYHRVILLLNILFSLTLTPLFAQSVPKETMDWQFEIKKDSQVQNNYHFIINGKPLFTDWHIWVLDMTSEFLIPTQIVIESNDKIAWHDSTQVVGEIYAFSDEIFGDVAYYPGEVTFIKTFSSKKCLNNSSISGYVIYQACNSSSCLPPKKVEFNLAIP